MSLNSFGNQLRSGPLGIIFFGIVILCVGVLAFTGLGGNLKPQTDTTPVATPSDVIAKVNGTSISVGEFENALDNVKEQASAYGPPPSILESSSIRTEALNQLETRLFAAQVARDRGLTVSDSQLQAERQKALSKIKTELGLPASASEDDVSSSLAANNVSLDDYINNNQIKTDLLLQAYQTDLNNRSAATDAQVRAYYEQVEARHILISNRTRPDAQAQALAADLIQRLNKGADFGSLAKQYSDDPTTKSSGGSDGFIGQQNPFGPEFTAAAFALKPGQITPQPVRSPTYGYFIIQVQQTKSNLPKDYAKNSQQYAATVTSNIVQQTEQSEISAEKAKSVVDILDSRLKADVALSTLQQNDPNKNTVLQNAIKDYNSALKNGDESDKAEIYASLAEAYAMLNQPDQEISNLKLALSNVVDSQLYIMLGDLYRKQGDIADALTNYQHASDHSYNDPQVHEQLAQDYVSLKQPVLAAKENTWLKSFLARQKQASASPNLIPQP